MSARVLVHRPESAHADDATGLVVVDDAAVAARLAQLAGLEQLPGLVVQLGDCMVSTEPSVEAEQRVRGFVARGLARVGRPLAEQQRMVALPETMTGQQLRDQLQANLTAQRRHSAEELHRRTQRQYRLEDAHEAAEN